MQAPPRFSQNNVVRSDQELFPSVPSHQIDVPRPPQHTVNAPLDMNGALVQQMVSIGFNQEYSEEALRRCNGVLDDAIMLCAEQGDEGMQIFVNETRVRRHLSPNTNLAVRDSASAATATAETQSAAAPGKKKGMMPKFMSSMFGKNKDKASRDRLLDREEPTLVPEQASISTIAPVPPLEAAAGLAAAQLEREAEPVGSIDSGFSAPPPQVSSSAIDCDLVRRDTAGHSFADTPDDRTPSATWAAVHSPGAPSAGPLGVRPTSPSVQPARYPGLSVSSESDSSVPTAPREDTVWSELPAASEEAAVDSVVADAEAAHNASGFEFRELGVGASEEEEEIVGAEAAAVTPERAGSSAEEGTGGLSPLLNWMNEPPADPYVFPEPASIDPPAAAASPVPDDVAEVTPALQSPEVDGADVVEAQDDDVISRDSDASDLPLLSDNVVAEPDEDGEVAVPDVPVLDSVVVGVSEEAEMSLEGLRGVLGTTRPRSHRSVVGDNVSVHSVVSDGAASVVSADDPVDSIPVTEPQSDVINAPSAVEPDAEPEPATIPVPALVGARQATPPVSSSTRPANNRFNMGAMPPMPMPSTFNARKPLKALRKPELINANEIDEVTPTEEPLRSTRSQSPPLPAATAVASTATSAGSTTTAATATPAVEEAESVDAAISNDSKSSTEVSVLSPAFTVRPVGGHARAASSTDSSSIRSPGIYSRRRVDLPTLASRNIATDADSVVIDMPADMSTLPVATKVFVPPFSDKASDTFIRDGPPVADALIPLRVRDCPARVTNSYTASSDGVLYMAVAAPMPESQDLLDELAALRRSYNGVTQGDTRGKKDLRRASLTSMVHRSVFGELYSDGPDAGRADMVQESLQRRTFLPYEIIKQQLMMPSRIVETHFKAVVVTSQAFHNPSAAPTTPNGLPVKYAVAICDTIEQARTLCVQYSVPQWGGNAVDLNPMDARSKKAERKEKQACILCKITFAMFNPGHHCRNCGFMVCGKCSDKIWPANMLPFTYHGHCGTEKDIQSGDVTREGNPKKCVRVCDSCHVLMMMFVKALRDGDLIKAKALYATGNVNVHHPYSLFAFSEFAPHIAAKSGSIEMMRWLLEVLDVKIRRNDTTHLVTRLANNSNFNRPKKHLDVPYKNALGLTVLSIAAKYAHVPLMRYLVRHQRCSVAEIEDVSILLRGLHVSLEAPGAIPAVAILNKGWFRDQKIELVEAAHSSSNGGDAEDNDASSSFAAAASPAKAPDAAAPRTGGVRASFLIPNFLVHIPHVPAKTLTLTDWPEEESEDEDDDIHEDGDLPDEAWTVGVQLATERASERTETASLASTARSVAQNKKKKVAPTAEPKRPKPPVTLKEDDFRIVTMESNRKINPLAVELVERAMKENMERMLPRMSEADRNHYVKKFNLQPPGDPSASSSSATASLIQSAPMSILPPATRAAKPLTHQQRLLNLRRPRTRPYTARDVYLWHDDGSIEAQNPHCPPPPISSLILGEYGDASQSVTLNSTRRDSGGSSSSRDRAPSNVSVSPSTGGGAVFARDLSQPFRTVPPLTSPRPPSHTAPTSPDLPQPTRVNSAPTSPNPGWTVPDNESSTDPFRLPNDTDTTNPFGSNGDASTSTDPFRLPVDSTDPFRLPASSTDPFAPSR